MAEYKGTNPADFNKVLSLANARMQRDPLPSTSALRIITKWLDTKKPQTLNSTVSAHKAYGSAGFVEARPRGRSRGAGEGDVVR